MKKNAVLYFAICLMSVSVLMDGTAAYASPASDGGGDGTVKADGRAASQNEWGHQDDYEDSPCERFPKDQIFDNFQQAFATPEKVKCLAPNVGGELAKIRHLPRGLGALVNLEVLSLACLEELEDLPEEIGNLRKLQALIIDNGNGCAMNLSLPRSIGRLENLKVLRLYGALDPRDVDAQSARRPRFKALPDTIGNLRRLEVLDLGRNGLKSVPPQIASLTQLKKLRLEYNDLRDVPAFVGNFKNLKELSLDSNRLARLPVSLAKTRGLKVSMGNNSLKLRDQRILRSRFPGVSFSFENEYDDSAANEEPRRPKTRPKRKQ